MQDEAPPEMDSLDQVIMAAALVEKAEAQGGVQGLGQIHVSVQGVTEALEECSSAPHLRLLPKSESELPASKRQKLGDVDRAGRRFVCRICLSKFKEVDKACYIVSLNLLSKAVEYLFKLEPSSVTYQCNLICLRWEQVHSNGIIMLFHRVLELQFTRSHKVDKYRI